MFMEWINSASMNTEPLSIPSRLVPTNTDGAAIFASAKPEFKTILCCNKIKILERPSFQQAFGHPWRKLHYPCTHWRSDRKENEDPTFNKPWGVKEGMETDRERSVHDGMLIAVILQYLGASMASLDWGVYLWKCQTRRPCEWLQRVD